MEGGELEQGNREMPRERSRRSRERESSSIATYVFVILLLTLILVVFAPDQFTQFIHTVTGIYVQAFQVLIILIVISIVVYVLVKRGKL